jgi:hypothetical protein
MRFRCSLTNGYGAAYETNGCGAAYETNGCGAAYEILVRSAHVISAPVLDSRPI